MMNYLPIGNGEAWPPLYSDYATFYSMVGGQPMPEEDFKAKTWLTLKHYQAWLFAAIHLEDNRLRLAIYDTIGTLTVSLNDQRKLFSNPIVGVDLSHVTLEDGIGIDEFVDRVARACVLVLRARQHD